MGDIMGKAKAFLGMAAALVFVSLLLWAHIERMKVVKLQRDTALDNLQAQSLLLNKERENAAQAATRASDYLNDRNKSNEELQGLRDCVSAGTCGVRVRTVYKPVPNSGCAATGTAGADAGHKRSLEQDYFDLRDRIALTEDRYRALQRELIARSDPGYCGAKKSPD